MGFKAFSLHHKHLEKNEICIMLQHNREYTLIMVRVLGKLIFCASENWHNSLTLGNCTVLQEKNIKAFV